MILIGIGSNLPSQRAGPPRATCEAALAAIERAGLRPLGRSRWYRAAPVPPSADPWYVNGVAAWAAALTPAEILAALQRIEADFGRVRGPRNAPRTLDLDLLACGDLVVEGEDGVIVPHPRLHLRAFVLLPLREVAPGWRHPVLGLAVDALIAALPPGQIAEPLDAAPAGAAAGLSPG